jgi:hypothetical protein
MKRRGLVGNMSEELHHAVTAPSWFVPGPTPGSGARRNQEVAPTKHCTSTRYLQGYTRLRFKASLGGLEG